MSMQTSTATAVPNYQQPAPAPVPEMPQPSKNWGHRIFAIVLVVLCALAAALIPYNVIKSVSLESLGTPTEDSQVALYTAPLFRMLLDMIQGESKVLGAIPSYDVTGTIGIIYTLSIYLFAVAIVTALVLAVIAIFTRKAPGLVRASLVALVAGALIYSLTLSLACEIYTANQVLPINTPAIDIFSAALIAVCVIAYVVFSIIEIDTVAWLYTLQFVLTASFAALLMMAIGNSNALYAEDAAIFEKIAMFAGVAAMWVCPIIGLARIANEDGLVGDLVRYSLSLVAALLVTFASNNIILSLVAAVIALVQIIIVIVQMVVRHKEELEETKIAANEAATAGFHVEEYAEAYAYEGGPVAGVLMAEEVNPSFLPQNPHVNTAGYDFYNCKSFDPFIASLDQEERNAFTEIFILKFKGTMSELPDYVVGGDNKEFFRKVFIYLGQYRDRIPMKLLTKMYQFSMKL